MSYEETLEYLYSRLPMFSRIGAAAYKNNLDNTITLCSSLDNPERKFKSVHVAGTNGKGSVSHMLAAIFQQAGYKTGLYTSPHIHDFRERIRVNGEKIFEKFVVDFVERIRPVTEEIQPSFFELTVAMAFDFFATEKVDIAIIETGMGGRLDSTNVIDPVLSVITNIGMDHTQFLGDTVEKIAVEKAGIIKKETPVVIGTATPEILKVFTSRAAALDAPIKLASQSLKVRAIDNTGDSLKITIVNAQTEMVKTYQLSVRGIYQAENLCTVLTAVDILETLNYQLIPDHVDTALANIQKLTGLDGRWKQVSKYPVVILDVAHNEDGIRAVIKQVASEYPGRRLHFVLGFVKDKDITAVLKLFPDSASYYFTNARIPRALPATELQTLATVHGLTGMAFEDVNAALKSALEQADDDAVIIVCGSFFIISEVDEALVEINSKGKSKK